MIEPRPNYRHFQFSVAPMMGRTDRHFRYLARLISQRCKLYTEMLVDEALIRGKASRLLAHHQNEAPLALQLGGSDPNRLGLASQIAANYGFDEVNLNVGCPSPRVTAGHMGASLMAEPERVADCVEAMGRSSNLPVTVKTRLGIDQYDDFEFLSRFVEVVSRAGCQTFIVHARNAWLKGLNPKANRTVPPLNYQRVKALKQAYPHLHIILNGGLTSSAHALQEAQGLDGAMLGRAVYAKPWLLADLDKLVAFNPHDVPEVRLEEVLEHYFLYMQSQLRLGIPLSRMTRHLPALFAGQPGSKRIRRAIGSTDSRGSLRQLQVQLNLGWPAQAA